MEQNQQKENSKMNSDNRNPETKNQTRKDAYEPPVVRELESNFLKRYKGDTYIIPEDRIEEDNNKDM